VLLDLGEANNKTTGNWNNLTAQTAGFKATNPSQGTSLIDTAGVVRTGVEFVMVNDGQNGASLPVGTQGSGIALGDYPVTAVKDYFTIGAGGDNLYESEFTGLPAGSYTLRLFASRTGTSDKREGLYSINNGTPVLYESANNTANILTFNNVVPVAGKINLKIQVNAGSNFAHLGVLDLTRNS
jgi:hypothetical protein